MPRKGKAQQSAFDDGLASKAGRPLESYTVDNAVQMMSFNARALSESALTMVNGESRPQYFRSSTALLPHCHIQQRLRNMLIHWRHGKLISFFTLHSKWIHSLSVLRHIEVSGQ
jgi:hypothetical protein